MTLTRVNSNGITDGTIANADVSASAAIDKTKISGTAITAADTGTVTSALIADASVTDAKVANSAITTAKIADANVTSGKLASGAAVANIGYTPVNKAGDTMSGTHTYNGTTWGNSTGGHFIIANSNSVGSAATLRPINSTSFSAGWSLYAGASGSEIGDGSVGLFNHTAVSAPFRVDQSGRVRMPNQPSFLVQAVISDTVYATNTVVPWPNIINNNGNHFSTSTNRFTAPVAGAYLFSFVVWHNQALVGRVGIRVNGSLVGGSNSIHARLGEVGSDTAGLTAVLQLNANDYVDVFVVAGPVVMFHAQHFTGHLIG